MGILYLSVELLLDLLALIMGGVLLLKAKDNSPKFYWGIIAIAIGGVFAWENIGWLTIVTHTPEYRFTDLLNIEKMLKWYPMASIVALFPMASLLPGYLTPFKILSFLLPPILFVTIGVCYLGFNGTITPLYDMVQVFRHLNETDVVLRCIIFISSVVTPLFLFLYPLVSRKAYRDINRMMYGFMGFMVVFLIIYILFTLYINEFVFNLFGATAIVFTVFFSWQYLRSENPFSVYRKKESESDCSVFSYPVLPLFHKVEDFMMKELVYTDAGYSLSLLAQALHEKESMLSMAIKSGGFSSFREYVNHLRLEHFKSLAQKEPQRNIKELIYLSGFNSRATFYRIFSGKYGMSPSQFIETLKEPER